MAATPGYVLTDQHGRFSFDMPPLVRGVALVAPAGFISPEVAALVAAEQSICWRVVADGWETDGLRRRPLGTALVEDVVELPAFSADELVAWAIVLLPQRSIRSWARHWLQGDPGARSAGAAHRAAERLLAIEAWPCRAAAAAANGAPLKDLKSAVVASAELSRGVPPGTPTDARSPEHIGGRERVEAGLMPALQRARAILAGHYPAVKFDEPLA